MTVTDADREKAQEILRQAGEANPYLVSEDEARAGLTAAALALEREKARAPFLALAEELEAESRRAALLTSMAAVVATRVNRETADRIRRAAEETAE